MIKEKKVTASSPNPNPISPPNLHLSREEGTASLEGRVKVSPEDFRMGRSEQGEFPPPAHRIDDQNRALTANSRVPSEKQELFALLRQRLESMETSIACLHSYDRLLQSGHYRILEHILAIGQLARNERKVIDSLSLSETAHRVFDTRNAIVEYVVSQIPENRAEEVCFLIGRNGVGKSTALCYLCGDTMQARETNFGKSHYTSVERPELTETSNGICTFLPNIDEARGVIFVDFPCLSSMSGLLFEMGIQSAFKRLIEIYQPKLLLLESTSSSGSNHRHIGKENLKRSVLALTKSIEPPSTKMMEENWTIHNYAIPNCCSLKNLGQSDDRERCFKALKNAERVHDAPGILEPSSQLILLSCLEEKLIDTIMKMTAILKSREDYENEYREKGIVSALFSSSHPEVLELLSLPVMDPSCIKRLNDAVRMACNDKLEELLTASDSYFLGGL